MTFLFIVLALVAALYVSGCIVANHKIRTGRQEYDNRILVKGTLMSWLAVLLMELD